MDYDVFLFVFPFGCIMFIVLLFKVRDRKVLHSFLFLHNIISVVERSKKFLCKLQMFAIKNKLYNMQRVLCFRFLSFLFCLMFSFLLVSCGSENKSVRKVIGLSQCTLNDAWRQSMLREMQIALSDYDNLDLVVKDAGNDSEIQKRQIQELMDMDVDILIISPVQPEPVTDIAGKAYFAGIPTIITDRKIKSDNYTAYIGGDNYAIGKEAGIYASEFIKDNAKVLEIWGLPETSPAQERHNGFIDKLKEYGISVRIDSVHGDWLYSEALARLKANNIADDYDLVFCHNDMMAIAAGEYLAQTGSTNGDRPIIMGADAVYGAGLEAVADGRIDVSFLYPTCSKELVQLCRDVLNGDSIPKQTILPTGAVDAQTARSLMIQGKSIDGYQQSINAKKARIDDLSSRFGFLENSLLVFILLSLALLAVSAVVLIYYLKLKKQNKQLEVQKNELELQRCRLSELNSFIEENSRRQLRLFAEISHEIRTPLTLISGPLEKVCRLCSDRTVAEDLKLMSLNAEKLKAEVNRILDLGKLKSDKVRLNLSECKLNEFVADAKTYFDGMARQKRITFEFHDYPEEICLQLDRDLMEKVIFNLLSNSFKFTPVGGTISVSLVKEDAYAGFCVQDSGGGVPDPEAAFDYMNSGNIASGTGIGLFLVKSYTEMHGGKVELTNTDGGANFKVLLPVIVRDQEISEQYDGILRGQEIAILDEIGSSRFDDLILVVDDNEQMLSYISGILAENFNIVTASDGVQAMEKLASENVALVLSDVMMPHMNGFELCSAIKDDIKYCHIPVVLLTALSSETHLLQGGLHGADAYLSKPFSADLLKTTIYRLLQDRRKLNSVLLQRLLKDGAFKAPDLPVESLDDVFLRKFISRIDEVYADNRYNVEKLSEEVGMSRGHLYRKVKELTGVSPVEFLRNYRLKKSAELLKQKNMTISEICYAVGFTSPAYFTKCFREYFNTTPTEFVAS